MQRNREGYAITKKKKMMSKTQVIQKRNPSTKKYTGETPN